MTAPPWSRMFLLWPVYSAGKENATIAWSLTRKDRHCLILIKAPPWLTLILVPSRAWPNSPLKRCTWKLCLSLGYLRRSGASMISSTTGFWGIRCELSTNRIYPEMGWTKANLLSAFSQKMQKLCMITSFSVFCCFFKWLVHFMGKITYEIQAINWENKCHLWKKIWREELTTETRRPQRKDRTTKSTKDTKRKDLTADPRRRARTKIFITEAQQGDAEMGRDGDAARKAKKN